MASFGSGINPSLGAIDYSPILRGAEAQAQGIIAGSQGIARGIEQAGGAIASGIERYQRKKKETKAKEAEVKAGIQFLESMTKVKGLNPEAQGAALGVLDYINSGNVDLDAKLRAIGGAKDQMNMLIGLGQQAQEMGLKQQALNQQERELQAKLAGGMFDRPQKSPKSIVPMSLKQVAELRQQGIDVNGTPGEGGMVNVEKFSSFAPPAQTNVNMPDPSAGRAFDMLSRQYEKLQPFVMDTSDQEAIDILASGKAFTGLGAEKKLVLGKALQLFGVNALGDEVKDTEVLRALALRPAIEMAKTLGANPSDKDVAFLQDAQAGKIDLNASTIKRIAEARIRLKEKYLSAYNESLDATFPEGNPAYQQFRGVLTLRSPKKASVGKVQLSPAAQKYLE